MTSKRRCSLSLLFAINCIFNLTWFILECHWYEMGHVIVRLRKFITPHATCRNSHVLGSERVCFESRNTCSSLCSLSYYLLFFKQTGIFLAFVRLQDNFKRNTFLQTVLNIALFVGPLSKIIFLFTSLLFAIKILPQLSTLCRFHVTLFLVNFSETNVLTSFFLIIFHPSYFLGFCCVFIGVKNSVCLIANY